jgi:hypothetical protein
MFAIDQHSSLVICKKFCKFGSGNKQEKNEKKMSQAISSKSKKS